MTEQITDVAVCRQEPIVTKISEDYYVVVYHRDIPLSIAFAESIKTTNRLLSGGLKAVEEVPSRKGESPESPGTEAAESSGKDVDMAQDMAARPQNKEVPRPQSTEVARPPSKAATRLPLPPKKRPTTNAPEWKIIDRESRTIEYYGTSLRYSKTQFGVLEALILAEGHILTYQEIALAGWGEPTDRDTIEATIYQLNKNLKLEDIDVFISCRRGRMILTNKEQ